VRLDSVQIMEIQKNRFPYLLIDIATDVRPGIGAIGYKNLTINDWFFETHFPGNPVMPGALQIEAMVQMASLALFTIPDVAGGVAFLGELTAKFYKPARPGDKLNIVTTVSSWQRGVANFSAISSVDGVGVISKSDFVLTIPEIMKGFTP